MENIPKKHCEQLETYLNKEKGKGTKYIRPTVAARDAEIPERHALAILSHLTNDGALEAKLKVRCPSCGASHGGIYDTRSAVPEKTQECMCGESFDQSNESNWFVVYEIVGETSDFFLNVGERLRLFSESALNLSPSSFREQFIELRDMESKKIRGQKFDYFVALLFAQLDGSTVLPRYTGGSSGEIDVYINFAKSEDWLVRSLGVASLVENKWSSSKTSQSDVNAFESKVSEASKRQNTKIAFLLSMSGFTSDALESLDKDNTPRIVPLRQSDLEDMIDSGTAKPVIEKYAMY